MEVSICSCKHRLSRKVQIGQIFHYRNYLRRECVAFAVDIENVSLPGFYSIEAEVAECAAARGAGGAARVGHRHRRVRQTSAQWR